MFKIVTILIFVYLYKSNAQEGIIVYMESEEIQPNVAENVTYPSSFWSFDEQCKLSFGPDYYFFDSLSEFSDTQDLDKRCTTATCYSINDVSVVITLEPIDGLVCDEGKVCMKSRCLSVPYTLPLLKKDGYIAGMSCEDYLKKHIQYLPKLCSKGIIRDWCPIACDRLKAFTCQDQLFTCAAHSHLCENGKILETADLVKDKCPYTCGTCPKRQICDFSLNVCQNNGICIDFDENESQNNSAYSFKCLCLPGFTGKYCENYSPCLLNPCEKDTSCVQVGTYNYICS